MNYYLVDLENVRERGLWGADLLEADDTIVIFYSNSTNNVHAADRDRIMRGKASVDIRSVNVHTKNALDFELSLYVGILISGVRPEKIFIISEDHGYQAVTDAGNRTHELRGRTEKTVFLCRSILEAWYRKTMPLTTGQPDRAISVKELTKKAKDSDIIDMIADKLSIDPDVLYEMVRSGIDNPHELYIGLLHAYGRENGMKAYHIFNELKNRGRPD